MQKNKLNSGFTLIEIMVVMVIIGVMTTIITPWMFKKKPATELPIILSEFNDMVYFARQEAIANQINYRLRFKLNKETADFIVIEQEKDGPADSEKKIYEQVYSAYFKTKYEFSDAIKMQAFYIGKDEQFELNKKEAYCYVIPNGLVQDVMIHIIRKHQNEESKASFKMSPFFGKFDFYDGFLKPEK